MFARWLKPAIQFGLALALAGGAVAPDGLWDRKSKTARLLFL